MKRLLLLFPMLALTIFPAGAEQNPPDIQIDTRDPYLMIVQGTDELLATARDARAYYQDDPHRYYREIGKFVEQVVDIEHFTRGVMATYASVRRYRALETPEQKKAFLARVDKFGNVLLDSLITTYSKALLNIEGVRIETEEPARDFSDSAYAQIYQTIYNADGTPYAVQYSLHKNRDGEWKLYNITVEGINIGMVFRSQFASAVERNGGDIDAAIANWQQEQRPINVNGGGPAG